MSSFEGSSWSFEDIGRNSRVQVVYRALILLTVYLFICLLCFLFGQFDGLGLETAGREGDAHGVTPPGFGVAEVGSYEQLQLDLGLTDITKYFSYSKLWRLL